jgi:hypothetical protein
MVCCFSLKKSRKVARISAAVGILADMGKRARMLAGQGATSKVKRA